MTASSSWHDVTLRPNRQGQSTSRWVPLPRVAPVPVIGSSCTRSCAALSRGGLPFSGLPPPLIGGGSACPWPGLLPRNRPSSTLTSCPNRHDVLGRSQYALSSGSVAALCGWLAEESGGGLRHGDALARGRLPDPFGGGVRREAVAFHQHARGPLECLLLLRLRLDILGMVLVGPKRRQQLGEPPLGHLEDGQGLNEEVGCGLGDVLQLLGALVGLEDIQEDAVMDAGEIEDAELLDNRPPAELVGRPAAPVRRARKGTGERRERSRAGTARRRRRSQSTRPIGRSHCWACCS